MSDTLRIHPRPSETLPLRLPTAVIDALRAMAERRDMSLEALVRLYVGQGLRQDESDRFAERLLDSTAAVLHRRIASDQEVETILTEINLAARSVS